MGKIKILIVEDEYIIAEDIKRSLLILNYEVIATLSKGEEAIAFVNSQKPDLILMDIMLQGDITGLEAARRINEKLDIPIIFLTGYANESILQEATKANPFGYLLKPFEDKELHANIKMALYKSDMERKLRENRLFLRNVIDTVPDYIFVKDDQDKFVLVNKAMADIFGTTPQNMVDRKATDFFPVSNQKAASIHQIFTNNDVKAEQEPVFYPEQILSDLKGNEKWVQTTKVLLDNKADRSRTLGVAVDITSRKNSEIELQKSLDKMKRILEQTVQGLVLAVEIRDPYTAGHQKRVAVLAEAIGRKLGLSEDRLDGLRIAAIIHDIGKIYVPAEILNRPGKITPVEFNLIKLHPQNGYDILKSIEFPWPIAQIVYQHHEKIDGTGYPRQLKGDEILLEAQIISVADIVEAMLSHRPYRPSVGMERALNEVVKDRGVGYISEVVDCCQDLFLKEGFKFE